MKRNVEYTFCMKQFKPALIAMAVLLVTVLSWSIMHCLNHPQGIQMTLAAANAPTPSAPPVGVKDKMLHPYWGNCSKCHVVTNVGKPISKVMTGPPISINDKMLHDYWGNCLLCHKIIDGIPPKTLPGGGRGGRRVAFNQTNVQSLGLKVQTVNAAIMQQFSLQNKDGVLILEVIPGSAGEKAGFVEGDEIIRVNNVRIETINNLVNELHRAKPGSDVKVNVYRGKRSRNLFIKVPAAGQMIAATAPMTQNQVETLAEQLGVPKTQQAVQQALQKQRQAQRVAATAPMTQNQVETLAEQLGVPKTQQAVQQALQKQRQAQRVAATAPMTQNQVETLAEQLGVPKTQQAVQQALQKQQQAKAAANPYFGKVAVASMSNNINAPISQQFGSSPYFTVYDPTSNSYQSVANPNANDLSGRGIQSSQYIVDLGVSNVISGSFSRDSLNTLHTLRVNVYSGVTGSVREVLGAYISGQLVPENTNVQMFAVPQPRYPVTGGAIY
uniref:MamP-like magnetosome protein n=1 Tax=Candidatus Magnetananas rongchengensis TaxID=1463558 RepID=A0A3S6J4M2_9BACT|nr:MamP-like magnetosome protein [Candidatus Magnetananas rongchenensis]